MYGIKLNLKIYNYQIDFFFNVFVLFILLFVMFIFIILFDIYVFRIRNKNNRKQIAIKHTKQPI
jgi:hypothetical protein